MDRWGSVRSCWIMTGLFWWWDFLLGVSTHSPLIWHSPNPYHIESNSYFWIWLMFFVVLQCFTFITHSLLYLVSSFYQSCVPHSFIHSLTHCLTSAYSPLSRPHLPLFFTDSFIHTTHFNSDLLTNCSHTPYLPLFSYHFLLQEIFPI